MRKRVYLSENNLCAAHPGGYTHEYQDTAQPDNCQSHTDPLAARLPKGRWALGATHHSVDRFTRAPRRGGRLP